MTETQNKPPAKKKPGPKPKSAKQKYLEAFRSLSDDERMELGIEGLPDPVESDSGAATPYGLRCVSCGKIALTFLGEKMPGFDGKLVEPKEAVAALPVWKLAWVQRNPSGEDFRPDRMRPHCQACRREIDLWGGNNDQFDHTQVVHVESYEATQKAQRDQARKIRAGIIPDPTLDTPRMQTHPDFAGQPITTQDRGVPKIHGTEQYQKDMQVVQQYADAHGINPYEQVK